MTLDSLMLEDNRQLCGSIALANFLIQIQPRWIVFFDQLNLPLWLPFLKLFFPGDSGGHVFSLLKVDKVTHPVLSGKTVN